MNCLFRYCFSSVQNYTVLVVSVDHIFCINMIPCVAMTNAVLICILHNNNYVTRQKIVSEYDQEIPQSQIADNPVAPEEELLNHHETPGRQIKQSNQLSLPHQDDCNTRMDIT